jgi:hypothetical protein
MSPAELKMGELKALVAEIRDDLGAIARPESMEPSRREKGHIRNC